VAELVLDDLWKVFPDGTEAVRGLDLDIASGEFVVLVGPSGCGKTTALRMIAGLEAITRGTVSIGDRVVNALPPRDRDLAMVFQNYALYPHMTVFDNMAFGLKLQKVPKAEIEDRVREAASILSLKELLGRKPAALSGGQRQRVAMGRAIVRHPQAFLMDEPLSNLDAKLRVQMRSEIARIQRELGVTTVYVTHDQVEAMTMGDRVAVMRRGELQQLDAPQTLYDRPDNLFVAGFIGSPAMNLLDARLEGGDGSLVVRFGSHVLPVPAALVADRPDLKRFEDGPVVLGIRPEAIEDAAFASGAPDDQRLAVTVDLREALGSEVVAHFTLDAPPPTSEHARDLASDVGVEAVESVERTAQEGRSTVVARLDARTSARPGERIDVVVDTERLHFFDPDDGSGIYGPTTTG
jgi:multiple sugar transport system ATP-binding protein